MRCILFIIIKYFIFCVFIYILNTDIVINSNIYDNETGLNVIADKNFGCEVNVVYDPPEDGLLKAETYVGVGE
jgi:hypothetical protein